MLNQTSQGPLVSVIIPAYNAAGFIGDTLNSVFAQTYSNYEVILVNDGSPDTDELEKVIEPFRDRLIYLEQENKGPSAARNNAIRKARGELVAFLDSDDNWLPDYLAEQIGLIEGEPRFDMVYSDAWLFGDSPLAGRRFMECAPSVGPVTFESLLLYQTSVITSGTVVRRQAVIDAGLFDERFIRCEDFDLWIRLAHRGARIGFQEQVLARHRAHGASLAANEIAMVESQIEVLKKAKQTLSLSEAEHELIDRQLENCAAQIDRERGKQYLATRNYDQAAASFTRANTFYKSRKLQLVIWGLRLTPRIVRYLANVRMSPKRLASSPPIPK
jgi:glycosyltransferase involved in cell wall biosynthesis